MTLAAYRLLIILFAAITAGGAALWLALRPTRSATRLGMRGLKRQRALLRPGWATIEPLVRWAGVRVSGVLAEKTRSELDRTLTYAGDFLGLTVDEYFAMLVLGGLLGAAAGGIATFCSGRLWPSIPALAAMGTFAPYVLVDNARVQRFRGINRTLPYAIDMMSLSMSAGLDFPGALQQVVNKSKANEALRDELAYMLQQFHLGRTRAQVLRELVARAPSESVREFVHALLQAEERGTPVASVLETQASTSRIRRTNVAESAASDMKGKMVLPIMLLSVVGLLLVMIPASMMVENLTNGGLR